MRRSARRSSKALEGLETSSSKRTLNLLMPDEAQCQDEGERRRALQLSRKSFSFRIACSLQACLNKNTYSPDKFSEHLRRLYECCGRMYEQRSGKGESTACSNERVVKRWLKDHSKVTERTAFTWISWLSASYVYSDNSVRRQSPCYSRTP